MGIPFCGRTGRELDERYLPLAGFDRGRVRVTNSRMCPSPNWKNPTKEEALSCSSYWLHSELRSTRPKWIVPMGAVACSLFPELDLESHHGIPQYGSFGSWEGILFPTYHPAIGLHEGSWIKVMRDDFTSLKEAYAYWKETGDIIQPEDAHPNPRCTQLTNPSQLSLLLGSYNPDTLAIDTEVVSMVNRIPYCFSFSFSPDAGYVIFLDNPDTVAEFIEWAYYTNPLMIFHNYLFDAPIGQDIGIPIRRFQDTMQTAYNIQSIPRGLKALAYRLCGMRMSSFNDVVKPHAMLKVGDWLVESISILHDQLYTYRGKPSKRHPGGNPLKTKRKRPGITTEQTRTYNKLEKMLSDLDSGSLDNPWKRFNEWYPHDHEFLTSSLPRPFPELSITHAPRDEVIPYAAADAIATWRIRSPLTEMAVDIRRHILQ
jgi:uracil-DNA glycosylase family 4